MMYDHERMMEHLGKEMDKKAESGIRNMTDLDTITKLAQAMKDLAKTEYYCTVTEAMENEGYSHNDGYSERRKRDSMGRYSRDYERGSSYNHGGAYDRYMGAKNSYRSSRSPEHKKEMSNYLGEYKDELKEIVNGLLSGADTREEREEIRKMIREIGEMA
jgi:hypothetical protein